MQHLEDARPAVGLPYVIEFRVRGQDLEFVPVLARRGERNEFAQDGLGGHARDVVVGRQHVLHGTHGTLAHGA